MKSKNKVESRIKKKRVSLVSKFALIIGISITYSVFFIAAYNIYASSPLLEKYNLDKANEYKAVSNLIYQEYQKERPYEFRAFVNNLVENDLVLHVKVTDKSTNEHLWSSAQVDLDKENIISKEYDFNNDALVISFYKDEVFFNLVEVLKNGNYMLGGTFVILGIISAMVLAKQVTKPVEELVIGVWEFSKGNLDYRTSIATDDEIGILGKAFNYMAEKLNELYTSLEHKVKVRTQELSQKNIELNEAYDELKNAQALLVHNEKMRSLGEMVAGVAHELNNPINFIYGNMTHLRGYSEDLINIISLYEEGKADEIDGFKEEVDYEFLKEDISSLITSCIEGAERSKNIVLELKNFSRLDQSVVKEINVNESIDSTLNILITKYKDVTIHKEYGDIPMLTCYAGQLNQVFMNILDNAAQAIPDSGNVYIRTKFENETVIVEIEDSGEGIEQEIIPKIFDPFFTTKAVGSGSGLGLSISYKIVKSHNGEIEVESEKGKGTKFAIKIPLNWEKEAKKDTEVTEGPEVEV